MKEVSVKKFADVKSSIGTYAHWYESVNGVRVPCDEQIIDYLWRKWIVSKNSSRGVEPNTSIMIFNKPLKVKL